MPRDTLYDSCRPQASPQPQVRERLVREGAASLSDAELLAALLGTGMRGKSVNDFADEVLALLVSSKKVPDADMLGNLAGIGGAKASATCAALELGRRLYVVRDKKISSPA